MLGAGSGGTGETEGLMAGAGKGEEDSVYAARADAPEELKLLRSD